MCSSGSKMHMQAWEEIGEKKMCGPEFSKSWSVADCEREKTRDESRKREINFWAGNEWCNNDSPFQWLWLLKIGKWYNTCCQLVWQSYKRLSTRKVKSTLDGREEETTYFHPRLQWANLAHQGRIYGTGMPVPLHVFLLEPGANDPTGQFQVNLKWCWCGLE
jgi:hypothetical protein